VYSILGFGFWVKRGKSCGGMVNFKRCKYVLVLVLALRYPNINSSKSKHLTVSLFLYLTSQSYPVALVGFTLPAVCISLTAASSLQQKGS
jgi:hypothetical protein